MKYIKIGIVLILCVLIKFNLQAQNDCDSTLFKQLLKYGKSKTISIEDFQKCQHIVNQLWIQHCQFYTKVINDQNYVISSLTFEYGKICIKANPEYSVKSFIDYIIDNKNSAEEQIAFSFENIYVKYPKAVLIEISNFDNETRKEMIILLALGFVNNRCYGSKDPFADNPMKAMTVYNDPPKIVLDSTNYKKIYFSLNPEIQSLYPKYKKLMDDVLDMILTMIRFSEDQKKKINK